MTDTHSTSLLLVLCISYLLGTGMVALTWGRRFEKHVHWLIWSGIAVLAAGLGLSGRALLELNQKAADWPRGWIWPRSEGGAITVGLLQDFLGIAVTGIAAVAASVLLLNYREYSNRDAANQRPERIHAAIAVSLAGVSLGWLSLTPWLGFVGMTLVLFGGFLALGCRWDSDEEADLASKFLWQRSWGLTFAVLGAAGLAGSGMVLSWQGQTLLAFQSEHLRGETIGIALLLIGLFLQFQPFPFLGGLVKDTKSPVPVRTVLIQAFPAWTAFSVLIRLEPSLRGQTILLAFGWAQLASALLTLITGFAQKEWRLTLGVWLASGFSLGTAALAFSGPWAALAVLFGSSMGGLVLAFEGAAIEIGGSSSQSNRNRAKWAKAFAFSGSAAATGMMGFASAAGLLHWILQVWPDPYLTAAPLVAILLFSTLGWRIAWSLLGMKSTTQAGWVAVLSPLILILLSLACVWTGGATGGAIFGSPPPDQFFLSFLDLCTGLASPSAGTHEENVFWAATGAYWAVVLVALGLSFWMSRKTEGIRSRSTSMAGTVEFLRSGYKTDQLSGLALRGVSRAGIRIQWLVEEKTWGKWVPGALAFGVRKSASGFNRADELVSRRLRNGLRHSVEIPAKVLQLIQSGDVQWYLVFAIGSGIAILAHFLRVK